MTRKENLCIANSECSKYEDLRTREQAEKKLVIDYVITTKRDLNKIKTMEIDEEKEFRICKVKMQNKKQWKSQCYNDKYRYERKRQEKKVIRSTIKSWNKNE